MTDSVYFGDMMRTLHEILKELKSMNKKLDEINSAKKSKKRGQKSKSKKSDNEFGNEGTDYSFKLT